MKKRIYFIAIMLCSMIASCTETTIIEPDDASQAAAIELSDNKLIFDVDGGCVAIVVNATTDGWEYTTEGDWFTVEKKGDNTLEISATLNPSPSLLNGSVTVSGEKNGTRVESKIALTQRTDRSINLSAAGVANCYIAKTNSAYKFDATVKGNGAGDGRSTYIATYGVNITDVAYADLVWEARNDGDRTMSREIIDGAPVYYKGYIKFSTGRSEGNAVISVRDINGNILWSWHIWVCNDEITSHDHLNTSTQVVAEIMDRNLGALNNKPMDINNRGMFYQWGRKDPFMPSRSPYNLDAGFTVADNEANNEVGNGSGRWQLSVPMLPLTDAIGNIPNAIQHPMSFLILYYSDVYEWHSTGDGVEITDSGLWDDKKTIFDPCPAGYKVPGKNMWGIPVGTTSVDTAGRVEEYDENGQSPLYVWNAAKDCGRCWKYTGDYYPMAGNVTIVPATPISNTSVYGFYWTTHRSQVAGATFWAKFTAYWGQYTSTSHVFSGQIRCVKE